MASRKNRTAIGAIAFILLLGLTFVALDQRDQLSGDDAQMPIVNMPESSISELQVTRPNEKTTVLRKVDGQWRVTAPIDAKADISAVNTAILKLSQTSVKSIVSTKPDHYQRLEVDPEQAVHIAVTHGSGDVTKLDVGKYANGYTMARVNDSEVVYGLEGEFLPAVDRSLDKWRDTKILYVQPRSVTAVTYDSDRGRFSFVRDAAMTDELPWRQAEGEAPIENFEARRVSGLVSSLVNLRAVGFAGDEIDASEAGLEPPLGVITMTGIADSGSFGVRPGEPIKAEEPSGPQTFVIEVGGPSEDEKSYYLRRRGGDPIYIISGHTHNRLRPATKFFQEQGAAGAQGTEGSAELVQQ